MTGSSSQLHRHLIQIPAFILLTLMFLGFAPQTFASTKSEAKDGEYAFVFKPVHDVKPPEWLGKNPRLELSIRANSYEEAFKQASKECFTRFKSGQSLNEQDGLAIIDMCANPRGS